MNKLFFKMSTTRKTHNQKLTKTLETNTTSDRADEKSQNITNLLITNNTINNTNTKTIAKNILNSKNKKDAELKSNNTMPAKVINNTTNINIINYNCYNNSPNRNNNIPLPKK